MAPVRSPERRDETTIDIGVALAIFVGVLAAGRVLLGVAVVAVGLSDAAVSRLSTALAVAAAIVSVRYLIRRNHA